MGGSQGARKLNSIVAGAFGEGATGENLPQVLHIAGPGDVERVEKEVGQREGYRVVGFCDRMPDAYAVADAVAPLGVEDVQMPFTPERVWTALQAAKVAAQ